MKVFFKISSYTICLDRTWKHWGARLNLCFGYFLPPTFNALNMTSSTFGWLWNWGSGWDGELGEWWGIKSSHFHLFSGRLPRTGGLHPWLAHPRRSLKSQGSGVAVGVWGVKQGQRLPSWVLPPAIKGEPRFCQRKYQPCRNVGSWNDLNSIFFYS